MANTSPFGLDYLSELSLVILFHIAHSLPCVPPLASSYDMQPVRLIQALPLPRGTIIHQSFLPGSSLLLPSPQAFQMLTVSINWKHIKIIESDHIVKYFNTYIPCRNTLTSSSSRSLIFIMQRMYMKQ